MKLRPGLSAILLGLMMLATSPNGFANAGGSDVGGGDAVRLDMMTTHDTILKNIAYWGSLQDEGVSPDLLRKVINLIGTGKNFRIQDHVRDGLTPLASSESIRVPSITLSREIWLQSQSDSAGKIGLELHPYLVLLGVEPVNDPYVSDLVVSEVRMEEAFEQQQDSKISDSDKITLWQNMRGAYGFSPSGKPDQRKINIDHWLRATAVDATTPAPDANRTETVREDVLRMRDYIRANCDQWQALKDARVSATSLREKIDQVGSGSRIKIQDRVSLPDGVSRSGINHPGGPDIAFSSLFWLAADADQVRKLGIELHEFLGLMKIEKTDDYHVSDAVTIELRTRTMTGDPSAMVLAPTPALRPAHAAGCGDMTGIWMAEDTINGPRYSGNRGYYIQQNGCSAFTMRMVWVRENGNVSWHAYEGTPNVSVVDGQRHLRFENTIYHTEQTHHPMIYSGHYENQVYIEDYQQPDGSAECEVGQWSMTLVDSITLDLRRHESKCKSEPTREAGVVRMKKIMSAKP